MTIDFQLPPDAVDDARHHAEAAAENLRAVRGAMKALSDVLDGAAQYDKILLRAAAGAGKSYALVDMVREALAHTHCTRVGITAFANKQVFPLAEAVGTALGAERVCLYVSAKQLANVPESAADVVTVATKIDEIPTDISVILGTSHMLGGFQAKRLIQVLDPATDGKRPFDLLMVDEAWQLPLHRFVTVERLAAVVIGVGDVGQLPPLDPSANPWRGDPGYNPYRAWPTDYEGLETTYAVDLPAVWRPTSAQLPLWRAFYSDWEHLDCVAGPEDRTVELPSLHGFTLDVWSAVATGVPTLLEVDGLADAEAADVDLPLLGVVEALLSALFKGGVSLLKERYDGVGNPVGAERVSSDCQPGDPLLVILATRNQTVDDAAEMVARLSEKFDLPDGVLVASTVDSWQGQTNGITVALHPLSGASKLDDFNSAFGRLAVTCTRATHGLLLLARAGIDDLLATVPPKQGTPFGEPGLRVLPRQNHQRILRTFARGTLMME